MLKLTSLHLTNFGPFKGEQAIDFPDDGVTVVYGENMRGKTTLLNAIRFAFFGFVLGRGQRRIDLHKLGNWEAAKEGDYGFQVRLELSYDDVKYRLTRIFRPRPGISEPASESDYIKDHYVEREGLPLGPHQAKEALDRILPEHIARFFLFDGELLQEYEELLVSDSEMGPKISAAIEGILGLPVLTDTRESVGQAKARAENRLARAAQGDLKTRELGDQLAQLQEERSVLVADLHKQEQELERLRKSRAALDEAMRRFARLQAKVDRLDYLEKEIIDLKSRRDAQLEQMTDAMGSAWCALIGEPMRRAMGELRKRELDLHTALTRSSLLEELAQGKETECPACLQHVDEAARQRVSAALAARGGAAGAAEQAELTTVRARMTAIEKLLGETNPEVLQLHWSTLDQIDRDIYANQREIEAIKEELDSDEEENVRRTRVDLDSVMREIIATENGIAEIRKAIQENDNFRDSTQRKLSKYAGSSLDLERKRQELAATLEQLFSDGVDLYRDQLRRRVEADATKHFRELTSEPDYAGLRINDNYGLTIVHKDGSDIPVRSAGAEHVVAFSLVGALQNNAPLRGPVVIDSPFGRLDGVHRENTVSVLPSIASQVVVLVYEDELPPAEARKSFKGRLKGEWKLKRRSARHTDLVPAE